MADPFVYRALFPPHFTPRTAGTGDNSQRHWSTLRPPIIRAVGPLWSFGLNLRELTTAGLPDGPSPAKSVGVAMRGLFETESAPPLDGLKSYAPPVLLRAEIESLLQVSAANKSATRLSLLAVDTIKSADENTVTAIKLEELGFANGTVPLSAEDSLAPTTLILAPFGGQPSPGKTDAYLPAMQLIHGRIRYEADAAYLKEVRTLLGLAPPQDIEPKLPANEIVLLPDGFCLTGTLILPWWIRGKGETGTSGWFKATYRKFPARGEVERGLTPWFGDEKSGAALRNHWKERTDDLMQILRESSRKSDRPRWLDVAPNAPIEPEHLFWREKVQRQPLLQAVDAKSVLIDCPGADIRLAIDQDQAEALSALTIQPDGLLVTGQDGTFDLTAVAGNPKTADGVGATYSFKKTDEKVTETIGFSDGAGAKKPMVLAMPLIETANVIRKASGLPEPVPPRPSKAQKQAEAAGTASPDPNPLTLLWTFTPVTGGWLHWPLPNATAGNLAPLIVSPGASEGTAEADVPPSIAGALAFANRPDRPAYFAGERNWSFSVGVFASANAAVRFSAREIHTATITLTGGGASFDGLFLVTPFAQTKERLLPDHDDRALRTIGLRAVSPALLRGVERDLWRQAAKNKANEPIIRLECRLGGLSFTPNSEKKGRPQLDGAPTVELETAFARRADDPVWSAMRPWLWLRHGELPAVQTLPMATVGAERPLPSGVRALAPLQIAIAPVGGRIRYDTTLNLSALSMALDIKMSKAAGEFETPNLQRPTLKTSARWRDEIAMAVTTLPSVSYRVGETPVSVGSKPEGWAKLGAGIPVFRHDLASRDADNAFAELPPPDKAVKLPEPAIQATDETEVRTEAERFSPLPGNGPTADPNAARPDEEPRTNGWDKVRLSLNRRAALAALDDREMFAEVDEDLKLTGVFGDVAYGLDVDPRVDPKTDIDAGTNTLASIGSLTFKTDDTGPGGVVQLGLPAETDLTGLKGVFSRDGAEVVLRFGVADLSTQPANTPHGRFTDQHGLDATSPAKTGDIFLREVTDKVRGRTVRLATLAKPLIIANAEEAEFICTDVPVNKEDGTGQAEESLLLNFAVDPSNADATVRRANAASREWNHIAGFRWSLIQPKGGDDFIIIDGLAFEPMELTELLISKADAIGLIRIRGRLRIPLLPHPKDLSPTPFMPAALGSVDLELRCTDAKASTWQGKLVAKNLDLDLADPDTFGGIAPRLRIDELPEIGKSSAGLITFELDGVPRTLGVTVEHKADGLSVTVKAKTSASAATGYDHARFAGFGALVPAAVRNDGKTAGATAASATLTFDVLAGEEGALFSATIERDLLSRAVSATKARHHFAAGNSLPLTVDKVALDTRSLMLRWTGPTTGTLFGGLQIASCSGSITAALAPSAKETEWPSYTIVDLRSRAAFQLKTAKGEKLELLLDDLGPVSAGRRALAYRLTGTLPLRNELSWPLVTPGNAGTYESATFPASPSSPFTHEIALKFDGQRIDPADIARHEGADSRAIPLMVEARHEITRPGSSERLDWCVHQIVWLSSAKVFAKRLSERAVMKLPASKQVRSGYAGIAGDVVKPLNALELHSHVYAAAAVDHGGISGPLAVQLAKEVGELPSLVVEFSNHALLAFGTQAGPSLAKLGAQPFLLGLPGFAITRDKAKPFVWSNKLAAMLGCRPDGGPDRTIWLAKADGYKAHRLPAIEPRIAQEGVRESKAAERRRDRRTADRASAVTYFDAETAHRAVFQPLTFTKDTANKLTIPVEDLPTAGTAFLLSALFADTEQGAGRDRTPLAIGFAGSRRIEAKDFFSELEPPDPDALKGPTKFEPTVYARALARFRTWLARHLVPGPTEPSPSAPKASTVLRLEVEAPTWDGKGIFTVANREVELPPSAEAPPPKEVPPKGVRAKLEDEASEWARRVLLGHAPWARLGVLTIRAEDFGLSGGSAHIIEASRWDEGFATEDPASARPAPKQPFEPVRQRQFEGMRSAEAKDRFIRGYAPLRTRPLVVASEPFFDGEGLTSGPRLTATALEVSWALAGGSHALLGGPDANLSALWLADRQSTAFRPFARHSATHSYDLTFATPLDYTVATPAGLLPAAHAEDGPPRHIPKPTGETPKAPAAYGLEQSFAPAFSASAEISTRPGAWVGMRAGLVEVAAAGSEAFRTRASERPVHARLPRPPILAVHDRTRASSHEPEHSRIAAVQSVIVHGSRAARPGASAIPVGLDRSPRSRWAARIALAEPADSVLRADWKGTIVLQTIGIFGVRPAGVEGWRIGSAQLVAGSARFAAQFNDRSLLGQNTADNRVALSWTPAKPAPGEVNPVAYLRSLRPATPVVLELMLECAEPQQGSTDIFTLRRRTRFALLTGGATQTGVETPLFAAFDDPEFNDRLAGLAQIARRPSPISPTNEFVFAADLSKLVSGEQIEGAVSVRPIEPGGHIAPLFTPRDDVLHYGDAPLRLMIERLRSGSDKSIRMMPIASVEEPVVVGAKYLETTTEAEKGQFELTGTADTSVIAFSVRTELLGAVTGDADPPLLPGDRLVIRFWRGPPPTSELASLAFDILARSASSPNPSSFALLALDRAASKEPAVHVQLYADSPPPSTIEIVDPRDLLDGVVRRRAKYVWRTFTPAATGNGLSFAIQKVNASGGTWLSDDLDEWKSLDASK
ncbi:hypothetical protein [Xanthobacter autotrophicus]|uniref:hypothetical protein n=1 Tax=Xanthobacter autotrophicus TaxID=280 RepID=UPI0037282AD7